MASDWIKAKDVEFQAQVCELLATITIHKDIWGLGSDDLAFLEQTNNGFAQALQTQAQQAEMYHARVAHKQATRSELEKALRVLVRRINNHPGMTDALRQTMNLASPSGTRTGNRNR